ncbi:MAG: hypothetical protein LBM70_00090 [Victivallales bacterium]|jgi:hypothetical protein|nr:hypothetical protein [Victivallales bacterium]
MNDGKNDFSIRQIEAAIDTLLSAKNDKVITSAKVIQALGGKKLKALSDRIDRTLASDDRFFDDNCGNFTCRSDFFSGYEFLITPDAWEIEQGVLFPGHRFTPYVNFEVFPSEIKLTGNGAKTVKLKMLTAPVSQIFHYHLLLGSEQVFDFFTAESPNNARLSRHLQPSDSVQLNVFDLKDFYQKHAFNVGDALLCRVEDWDSGVIAFEYLSGENRRDSELKSWIKAYEQSLETVFDRFENYPDIPEQLTYACFFGADTLPEAKKSASLDEFVRRTNEVEINFDSDHTVLAKRPNVADEYPMDLPEGMTLSRGETGDVGAMLREIGSPLTPVEVDSYIFDCCYTRELDFEEFFARAFGREKLHFTDEGQQAIFYNYIEERFEELSDTYNRVDDEPKAPLRSTILELVDDRLAFFDFLTSLGKKLDKLPSEDMRQLAALSLQLNEILKMLNNQGYTPDAGDLDRLAETVELRTDEQEELISKLTDRLEQGGESIQEKGQ